MDKKELIKKNQELDGLDNNKKSELLNTKKRYGLVWEDKPEEVEEQLLKALPVLTEVKERAILSKESKKKKAEEINIGNEKLSLFDDSHEKKNETQQPPPNHILIEGDNLHALTVLN